MRRVSLWCSGLLACVALLQVGCGSSSGGSPQEGTVEFEGGKPVEKATISFLPEASGGKVASGQVRDGKFKLNMEGDEVGCLPGKYKVIITGAALSMEESSEAMKTFKGPEGGMKAGMGMSAGMSASPAHPDFTTKEKTPLSVEVTGAKKDHKFTIRPPQ